MRLGAIRTGPQDSRVPSDRTQYGKSSFRIEAAGRKIDSVPRVLRLLALALHMDDLCRQGGVADYAELAHLSLVTRARMMQMMSLAVRPVSAVPDFRKQRMMWRGLKVGRFGHSTIK